MPTLAEQKTIERVEKLLRLAAPSSGTSEAERSSAALEAARLFSENNLSVREPKVKRQRIRTSSVTVTRTTPQQYRQGPPPPYWKQSIAARDAACADAECQGPISRGDPVYMRITVFDVEYLHGNWPACHDE